MFEKLTVEEYCKQLASRQPAPGGGSGLAQVGAIACSLIEMSIHVSLANMQETDDKYLFLLAEGNGLHRARMCMHRLSNDDAEAYNKIVSARKLPKTTDDEIKTRTVAMQKAFHKATLVPLELMQLSLDILTRANLRILDNVSKYVKSDCEIGINLLKTVIRNSVHNVKANTCYIKDERLQTTLNKQADDILSALNKIL